MWSEKGVFTFLFVLLENDQRRTVEKGVKTCISMNLPTAENLLRRQLKEQFRQRRNTGIL